AQAAKEQTFRQYIDRVWMPQKRATGARSSVRAYEVNLRLHVLPALGDSLLAEITPPMITALFYRLQAEGLAEKTLHLIWNITGEIFSTAVQDEILDHSPMTKARLILMTFMTLFTVCRKSFVLSALFASLPPGVR